MPKKSGRAASKPQPPAAKAAEEEEEEEDEASGAEAGEQQRRTFTAPSGKHFVLAQERYPEEVAAGIQAEVVTASEGDLLEMVLMHQDWGYGRRFKARAGAVNEGVFRLDWVSGVKLVLDGGQRRPVEVDVHSPQYAFQPMRAADTAGKLRLKRYRKKIEDVAQAWNDTLGDRVPSSSSQRLNDKAKAKAEAEAAAAQAAAALEKAVEGEKAKKLKAELKKRQQEMRKKQKAQEAQLEEPVPIPGPAAPEQVEDTSPCAGGRPAVPGDAGAAAENKAPGTPGERGQAGARAAERSGEGEEEASPGGDSSSPSCAGDGGVSSPTRLLTPERRSRAAGPMANQTWEAQWEQQAAHLESVLSASSSGVEDGLSDSSGRRRPTVQKKMLTRKVARSLVQAKRTGELHAIAEEWEKAQSEMASKASDMSALNAKVKNSLLTAHRAGDLERIAEEMVDEAEQKAAEVKALKERVFRALIDMKRARDVEKTASDMDDAQKELEVKALQLKNLMKRAWKGMAESRRTSELERIADEMAEQLQSKADALKNKIREGLLRAHRAGELLEIRDELDELADSVAVLDDEAAAMARGSTGAAWGGEGGLAAGLCTPRRGRRWAEYPSSDSDSSFDPREALRRRNQGLSASPTSDPDRVNAGGQAAAAAAAEVPPRGGATRDLQPKPRPMLVQRPPPPSPGEADVSASSDAELLEESSPGPRPARPPARARAPARAA